MFPLERDAPVKKNPSPEYIENIISISAHLPSGAIAIRHSSGVIMEWDTKPRECWVYPSSFWILWIELKWRPGQIRIPEPHKIIRRKGEWKNDVRDMLFP